MTATHCTKRIRRDSGKLFLTSEEGSYRRNPPTELVMLVGHCGPSEPIRYFNPQRKGVKYEWLK